MTQQLNMPRSSLVVLKVPGIAGRTPYMQTTERGLIVRCLEHLQQTYKDADMRNQVLILEDVRAAEFHRLERSDAAAGLMLLDFLMADGYWPERVDVSSDQMGTTVVACVYILRK